MRCVECMRGTVNVSGKPKRHGSYVRRLIEATMHLCIEASKFMLTMVPLSII